MGDSPEAEEMTEVRPSFAGLVRVYFIDMNRYIHNLLDIFLTYFLAYLYQINNSLMQWN